MGVKWAIAVLSLVFCGLAAAAEVHAAPSAPIYNPASKSYFQLFDDNTHPSTWRGAFKRAQQKTYKGARGRLAEIHDLATHQFILENFDIRDQRVDVWIGLRYWCSVRLLQWGRERPFSPSEAGHFRIWHRPWERYPNTPGGTCGRTGSKSAGYVPVYYRTANGATRWVATDAAKGFSYYLVEYPTGDK